MRSQVTVATEYARRLSLLTRDAFEAEVIVALQQTDLGFQRVPRKPNGDGGLDGLSSGGKIAYCCYGPDPIREPGLTDAKRRKMLVGNIVNKFTQDFARLLELSLTGKRFSHKPNMVLEGLFGDPSRTQIRHIRTITSWFEDNRIIGGINAAFTRLLPHGKCRFVAGDCEIIVWGPEDLANNVRVTQEALLRVEEPSLIAVLRETSSAAQSHEPADQDDFNDKFNELIRLNPTRADRVNRLRTSFKQAWSHSILLDEKLARDLPDIHRKLEEARRLAVDDAVLASAQITVDPVVLIENSRERLRTRIVESIHGGLPEKERVELAQAETGRLIGECHLDWRDA